VLDSTQPLGLARRGWPRHANGRTTASQLDGVYSRLLVMGSQTAWRRSLRNPIWLGRRVLRGALSFVLKASGGRGRAGRQTILPAIAAQTAQAGRSRACRRASVAA
jgi:hypothetical protein